MSQVQPDILDEIEKQKPPFVPALLSRAEKDRLLQRSFHSLYRWYVDRSQAKRNWNADRSFDWRAFGRNHSPELLTIVEGFYAVEQYVPDYTAELCRLMRASYGRSLFSIRWGAEEERHADVWRNVLLFSRRRTPEGIEQLTEELRASAWTLPFDCPIRMLLGVVFQERATQLNYLNLARVARGQSERPQFAPDTDPVLAQACMAIAVDEAAHYEFFLEGARLYLYYYPEETLLALVDVMRHFIMPASRIVPNYDAFIEALYGGGIFGRRMYAREVVPTALASLGIDSIREIERSMAHTRGVPDGSGQTPGTDTDVLHGPSLSGVRFSVVEAAIRRLFDRIERYEAEVGLSEVDPTRFVPNAQGSASAASRQGEVRAKSLAHKT